MIGAVRTSIRYRSRVARRCCRSCPTGVCRFCCAAKAPTCRRPPISAGRSTLPAMPWPTVSRRFRILAIVDDFSRECLCPVADTSLSGQARGGAGDRSPSSPCAAGPCPVRLRQRHRADQHGDPDLVAGAPGGVALHRTRQATAERLRRSFIGRLRDECLNETLFTSLAHVRAALAGWRHDYNTIRPHSEIGNVPPAAYTNASVHGLQRDGTLRSLAGFAPRPVAPPSLVGSDSNETLLIPG